MFSLGTFTGFAMYVFTNLDHNVNPFVIHLDFLLKPSFLVVFGPPRFLVSNRLTDFKIATTINGVKKAWP